jgi:molybdopterin-guanine dinucleotide biosynthesis protein A
MSGLGEVTALILAGGQGRRMGGEDKGLLDVAGKPLVQHVLEAVKPQVDGILISANRNHERYAAYGYRVLADPLEGYQGPLAGFLAGIRVARTPYLVTLPCDGPLLGGDLVARLRAALEAAGAEIAVAHDGRRLQPVYALLKTALRPSLEAYLAEGERKIDLWFGRHRWTTADFSDAPEQFANVNTPEDRARFEPGG